MTARCFALVPAAGTGTRIGSAIPKQYLPVAGRPMLCHALAALAAVSRIERITVVVAPADRWFDDLPLDEAIARRIEVVRHGGATRAASVAAGLAAMRPVDDDDWVLVHDAARCGITSRMVDGLIDRVVGHPAGGLLALPLDDTLKRCAAGGSPEEAAVDATIDRAGLWRAQTPQMFRHRLLSDALAGAAARDVVVTDESSAIEAAGHRPLLVAGSSRNFKVTTADDLAMMDSLLVPRPDRKPAR